MTKVFKSERFLGKNLYVIAEQYANKPNFIKFWRYVVYVNNIQACCKDMLTSKPNVKKIAEKYQF